MTTDTTFFTNEPGFTLLDRFKRTLKDVRYFDILVGYFTLINDIIQGEEISDKDAKPGYIYETYPAMKIARLATDKDWERKGIGTYMLMLSIAYAIRLNQVSACRFITVDALNGIVPFYIKMGFIPFHESTNSRTTPMYLNYFAVIKQIQKASTQREL